MGRFLVFNPSMFRRRAAALNTGSTDDDDLPLRPMPKVTPELLSSISTRGRFAVGRLLCNHDEPGCSTVPAGTLGVVRPAKTCGKVTFVFPREVLTGPKKTFRDGNARVVPRESVEIVGRCG